MIYEFASFRLDKERFQLTQDGDPVVLQPLAMRLLLLLLDADGQFLDKNCIHKTIWNGRVVSENALSSQIKLIRRALGDTHRPHRILATVHGAGFRIVVPVRRLAGAESSAAQPVLPLPVERDRKPTIAVLRLRALENAPLAENVSIGLPGDIITAMTHLQGLDVIAQSSSIVLGDSLEAAPDRNTAIPVDYLVGGTVETGPGSLRLRFELLERDGHRLLWSDFFEIVPSELHRLRAEIVSEVTRKIGVHISRHEAEMARFKDDEALTAWERFHLGMCALMGRAVPDFHEAASQFAKSVAISPRFSSAHAGLARSQIYRVYYGQDADLESALATAAASAQQATELDPLNSFANLVRSQALRMRTDLVNARVFGTQALSIAPNFAAAHVMMSGLELYEGNFQQSYRHGKRAAELDPRNPLRFENETHLALAATHLKYHEESVELCHELMADPISSMNDLAVGAALTCFHHAGAEEEAAKAADALRARGFSPSRLSVDQAFAHSAPETVDLVLQALAKHMPEVLRSQG